MYAKTQPDAGARGITAFIIERGMKVWVACSRPASVKRSEPVGHCRLPAVALQRWRWQWWPWQWELVRPWQQELVAATF